MFKLFGYWRSSCSWRVRWALHLKEQKFDYIPVNLLKAEHKEPAYLTLNPAGSVPTLIDPQGRALSESVAIIEYLDEYQPHPPLYPKDPFKRAQTRQLVEIINSGTQPLQNLATLRAHSSDLATQKAWAKYWIEKGLRTYDKVCTGICETFSTGPQISAADLFLVPQIYNALRFEIDVRMSFPKLWQIYQNALETEACQKSLPEQQVDAIK